MSKHRKTNSRTPRTSARTYVTTGVGGAAMVGVGAFLASPPGAPPPVTASPAVHLGSFDSLLAPASPATDDLWWWPDGGGDLIGSSFATPTLNLISFDIGNSCGLICDGADGTAASPNGQNGGLLFGN